MTYTLLIWEKLISHLPAIRQALADRWPDFANRVQAMAPYSRTYQTRQPSIRPSTNCMDSLCETARRARFSRVRCRARRSGQRIRLTHAPSFSKQPPIVSSRFAGKLTNSWRSYAWMRRAGPGVPGASL